MNKKYTEHQYCFFFESQKNKKYSLVKNWLEVDFDYSEEKVNELSCGQGFTHLHAMPIESLNIFIPKKPKPANKDKVFWIDNQFIPGANKKNRPNLMLIKFGSVDAGDQHFQWKLVEKKTLLKERKLTRLYVFSTVFFFKKHRH